jgi:Domain of unknown function (DUF4292)
MKENTLNNLLPGYSANYRERLFKSSIKIFVLFCALAAFGCKARKQLVSNHVVDSNAKAMNETHLKLEAIRAAQNKFDTFSGKARTKLNINGSTNDVTLNIRIKSGEKIWVSVTAFIEAARALITPDSILIMNKLEGVYIKKPFSYINSIVGKNVNFKTLESLLVGNVVPELIDKNADLQVKGDTTTVTGHLDDIIYKLVVGPGLKAYQTGMNNPTAEQSLLVTNSAFIQAGNKTIPSQIDIKSATKNKTVQINLRYIKTEFDTPLEYPFTIPERYTEGK